MNSIKIVRATYICLLGKIKSYITVDAIIFAFNCFVVLRSFFSGVARFTVCCSSMHRHSMHALINTTLYVIIVCLCRWSQCFFASIRFEQTRMYFIMQCCCSRPWQHFSIFVVFAAYSKIAIFPVFFCVNLQCPVFNKRKHVESLFRLIKL